MCGYCQDDTCKGDPCLVLQNDREMLLAAGGVTRVEGRDYIEDLMVPDEEQPDDWKSGPRGVLGGMFGYPLLWNHIEGNLFQGGCVDGFRLPDQFKHVVSMYPWEKYELGPNTDRVEYKFYDSNDQDLDQVLDIARHVNELIEDGPTLVHCQMGLNRSGLVVGTSLVLRGWSPGGAVELQRKKRDNYVLSNRHFYQYVMRLGERQSQPS